MDKSDIQETIFTLFLRLNGYFCTGYISHAPLGSGNRTEIDTLAVRFPHHVEPCLDIGTCPALAVPERAVDFLVCEVKGGKRRPNFNAAFRGNQESIRDALCRIGFLRLDEVQAAIPNVMAQLRPSILRQQTGFPSIPFLDGRVRLRFILVAMEQQREGKGHGPYLYGDDVIKDIWKHFRPEPPRPQSETRYNRDLWGEEYKTSVKYFKDFNRQEPGTIEDIYMYYRVSGMIK